MYHLASSHILGVMVFRDRINLSQKVYGRSPWSQLLFGDLVPTNVTGNLVVILLFHSWLVMHTVTLLKADSDMVFPVILC